MLTAGEICAPAPAFWYMDAVNSDRVLELLCAVSNEALKLPEAIRPFISACRLAPSSDWVLADVDVIRMIA
ncbi:hypothetical protein Aple_078410 [Acrocarpospora pleiomorpha]|uniref:Uncharacterized protein n=2 Tax=Acrocarpospora pleiomorpha TaxID=90975 RepID=A0A5M3XVD7_9ACTN|nr:hypothetical protein Aple_078410 [Acrocarpospora pleiomorpha]